MLPKAVAETASNGHAQATAGSLVKFYCVRQLACKIARHLGLVLQLAPPYRVIVTLARRSLDERTFEFTRGLFPLIGRSRISFTGSYVSARMISLVRELADATQSRPPREQHRICSDPRDLRTARSVCLQDQGTSKPSPVPSSLHEHDNRNRPPLTNDVLHHHRMRSVCAASAVF